jgi:hypothetical protein
MANLKEIFNQIELIKNILTDKNDVNEIPQIEYDIVMEKLRNIYEQMLVKECESHTSEIQHIDNKDVKNIIIPSTIADIDTSDEELCSSEPEIEIQVVPTIETQNDTIAPEPEQIQEPEPILASKSIVAEVQNDPLFDDIDNEIIERIYGNSAPTKGATTAPQEVEPQTVTQLEIGERRVLGDVLKNGSEVLNETLGNNATKDLATKLSSGYSDLRTQIGINDKFMFIRELFNNDENLYEHTVSSLNKYSDLDEALIFLNENFRWKGDNPAAQSFINMLIKKLS